MPVVRVCVLGGSSPFLPELGYALAARAADLPPIELVLSAPNAAKLELVAGFMSRASARHVGFPQVRAHTDRKAALEGADLVLNFVRVGGWERRAYYETFPLEFGIPGDESLGPGGLANAIHTMPVIRDVIADIEMRCPQATVINLTNPCDIMIAAVSRLSSVRLIGVCEIGTELVERVLQAMDARPGTRLGYAGTSHHGWCFADEGGDQAAFEQFLDRIDDDTVFGFEPRLIRALRAIPAPPLRNYLHRAQEAERMARLGQPRAKELADLATELLDYYRRADGEASPPALRQRRMTWHAKAVVPLLIALLGDAPVRLIVNTRNMGAVSCLPDDAIVETWATANRRSVRPEPCGSLPDAIRGFTCAVEAYSRVAAIAALEPSKVHVLAALLANPMVATEDLAEKLLPLVMSDSLA